MEAARTSETSVYNYFTRQYIPEDNSKHEPLPLILSRFRQRKTDRGSEIPVPADNPSPVTRSLEQVQESTTRRDAVTGEVKWRVGFDTPFDVIRRNDSYDH
jgi:hypothetical protein